jgi:hypothetical protein
VDAQYHVIQKAQDIGIQCIKFGLQADERYRLHEFISEGLYMLAAAGLKAAVAFKETPRYKGDQVVYENNDDTRHARHRSEPIENKFNVINNPNNRRNSGGSNPTTDSTSCLPPSPQKARSSWTWSPW